MPLIMREMKNNPPGNVLASSVNEANLIKKIELSGYPLQGIVVDKLKSEFFVTEEWGYIDRDTQDHRSLDIFAIKQLLNDTDIQPFLTLLIECKRSIHPYVFFKNSVDREIPRFPMITGLPYNSLNLYESSGNRYRETSSASLLGLIDLPFVCPGPPRCSAFTKAIIKGDKVDISGADPFNTLILPLVKATDHTLKLYKVNRNPPPLYPRLIIPLSILDAPIILVDSPSEVSNPLLPPWVRVPRQEAHPDQNGIKYIQYVVDVIHIDFFDDFLANHLFPFINEFVLRTQKQADVLLKGGVVENLDDWKWDEIHCR